jgi:hypothetical protein
MLVKAKYLFSLLLAMENMHEAVDPLDILSLGMKSKKNSVNFLITLKYTKHFFHPNTLFCLNNNCS